MKKLMALLAAFGFAFGMTARAELLFWDPFATGGSAGTDLAGHYNYGESYDTAHNRTVGNSVPFAVGEGGWAGNISRTDKFDVADGSLAYSSNGFDLVTAGGRLFQNSTQSNSTTRDLDATTQGELAGGTYFMSFLATAPDTQWSRIGLSRGNSANEQANALRLDFSQSGGNSRVRLQQGNSTGSYYTLEPTGTGNTFFFVVRVDYGASLTMWINPGLDKTQAEVDADLDYLFRDTISWSTTDAGGTGFDYIRAWWRIHGDATIDFDELRIGRDVWNEEKELVSSGWAAVTPIPEPGTLGLLAGVGALALIRRRLRRKD